MAKPGKTKIVPAVLQLHPKSYADELRIDLSKNTLAPLYQWLIASILFSARISAGIAQNAAKALFSEGWKTPAKMADVTWAERTRVLNRSGYARYDESTSRYIVDTTALLMERYDGDLRKLREAAGRAPARERELLKEFKGIGDVGADIFFREAQGAWDELYPFADKKAVAAAEKLGLGGDAKTLARLVSRKELPRLLTALVRVDLGKEMEEVMRKAA